MATIKDGYNGKELEIKLAGRSGSCIELWIVQEGLPEEIGTKYRETLSYISLEELVSLKREIEKAIMDYVGIGNGV